MQSLGSLVRGLLEANTAFRLGCGKLGTQEIKSHAWFSGFDWKAFAAKALAAPYIPKVREGAGIRQWHQWSLPRTAVA